MCERTSILILIFILKVIFLILSPLSFFYLINRFNNKYINILYKTNVIFLILLITLRIFNNPCVINSNISGIDHNMSKKSDNIIYETNSANTVERIVTNKIYTKSNKQKIYYFNINKLPLSNKKIYCDNDYAYMKNYGSSITALSIIVSSLYNENIDPIKLLDLSVENNIFDCETGVNTDELINLVNNNYNLSKREINYTELKDYIRNGGIVLAEINAGSKEKTVSCSASYIVIYDVDKQGNFSILNPNDKDYKYICPENSEGYGKVIDSNTNDKLYSLDDIKSISSRYIILER